MKTELNQYFTPAWAAELLIEQFYSLSKSDIVLDPTCGDGCMLSAVPRHVQAIGIEIDPRQAARAMNRTGRRVYVGDVSKVQIEERPTAVLGNPPFQMSVFDSILERCHAWLPDEAQAGFILPAYTFQTPSRTLRYNESWSIRAEMIPRTLFPGLSKPLVFALFRKDVERHLVGFALYRAAHDVASMPDHIQAILRQGRGSIWKKAVFKALHTLGGEASLSDIYAYMEPRRPTGTNWWREKVRQVLQAHCERTGHGVYGLPQIA